MRIPFLGKKRREVQQPTIDISHLATKEDIVNLSRERIEERRRIILASLNPRQREKLERILELKRRQKNENKK